MDDVHCHTFIPMSAPTYVVTNVGETLTVTWQKPRATDASCNKRSAKTQNLHLLFFKLFELLGELLQPLINPL